MKIRCRTNLILVLLAYLVLLSTVSNAADNYDADRALQRVLKEVGFTGRIEASVKQRLKRPRSQKLRRLGRLLFFDEILSLHNDNACAGCHTPAFGFGDPLSIAYGIANNHIVGPGRNGTRNERKAPLLTNVGFFPKLMLNGRFEANSGNPFDNSRGFTFPPPNENRFLPNDPLVPNLLTGQAFLPVASLVEMAGFQGTAGTLDPRFDAFDDGVGTPIPLPDATGTRQGPILDLVLDRLNTNPGYQDRFKAIFGPGDILFEWVGQALAEFQISLLAANAPIDRFARGDRSAMTPGQTRGALLFFGAAGCSSCHSVTGDSREMFSDFENYVVGVPQVHALFGVGSNNIVLDGLGEDEDFGRERISGDLNDRYRFRTSPLRNVALQSAFFHNGAFTNLEDAIRHHLDVFTSARNYDPDAAGLDVDLHFMGPREPVLARVDPLLTTPVGLSEAGFNDLVEFVRDGLLDPKALPAELCSQIPDRVPSGRSLPEFEGCEIVNVCHQRGKKGRGQTLIVSRLNLTDHLAHGDQRGSCKFQP